MMIERPILFSGPMVRAILDGRKTQTRRVCKRTVIGTDGKNYMAGQVIEGNAAVLAQCPYGQPGDRLWVREAWRTHSTSHDRIKPSDLRQGEHIIHYDATMNFIAPFIAPFLGRGRPSIHMPRWASRITLEVTDVRVQRLQDISYEDAVGEGCALALEPEKNEEETWDQTARRLQWPQRSFALLWDSINAKTAPWSSNPWVWAITFRKING